MERFVAVPLPGRVAPGALDRLTAREAEVLRLVAAGLNHAEIAGRLVVSEATVKTHLARLLTTLRPRDRVQAVVCAYEHGIVAQGRTG